jgi:hypothetical protein
MSKQSGLGDAFYVSGHDVSGDIGSLGNVGGGPTPLEVTGIDKSAFERIGGVLDGRIEYSPWFNPAIGRAHEVLAALPTGNVLQTYCRGTALGAPAASLIAKQLNHDGTRANDGALTFSGQGQASAGVPLEWGRLATAGVRHDTTATNGASIDDAAPSAFGLSAYLHVMAFTGTSATIKLQSSSDNGGADAWTDLTGGGFTAVTAAPGWQRIQTAPNAAIERYLRVISTGTFTVLDFAVVICRQEVEPEW